MKVWLGVIGRACLEFAIILVLISFAAGAERSIVGQSGGIYAIYENTASAALGLVPLASVLSLFSAFFSFELRVRSRGAGWLGLLLLGAVLFSFGIGVRRIPLLREVAAGSYGGAPKALRLIPTGAAIQQGRVALWIGAYEGGDAVDAVAVDFGSDYPRIAYSPRAAIDAATGDADIQGRSYRTALPAEEPRTLVPEVSFFSGFWIWDRLSALDRGPGYLAFAIAGGFLLFAIGFRFLCRITGWPLANAFLAAAGLAGLVLLDAALSGSASLGILESLAKRIGLSIHGPLLLACVEGFVGLVLAAVDLATAPRAKRRADE